MKKHTKRNSKKQASRPKKRGPQPPMIPDATYRLQFNRNFTFRDATRLLDYLRDLGISHCYASPLQKARPGSLHGYDIIDYGEINPEIGTPGDKKRFDRMLRQKGMGMIMDIVPNHMCVTDPGNHWWRDVLENGRPSPYSRFFDVDWNPPTAALRDKVFLPFLGRPYAKALEHQEIKVVYEGGSFQIEYFSMRFPINVSTYPSILIPAKEELRKTSGGQNSDVIQLQAILHDIENLPQPAAGVPGSLEARQKKVRIIKRQLDALISANGALRKAVLDSLAHLNGVKGQPRSFDRLDSLLGEQAYRLGYWREGAHEINYRRFFNINELASIRVEEAEVFDAVHGLIFEFMAQGVMSGLRVDHIDGLRAPQKYLHDLCQACSTPLGRAGREDRPRSGQNRRQKAPSSKQSFYLVVEKILGEDEELPKTWPVHGTTGYEFLNLLNGIFVDIRHEKTFLDLYARFTGCHQRFKDVVYECKKRILRTSMSSDLNRLTSHLVVIAGQHRSSQDYTDEALKAALAELIICFPVYRTYIGREQGSTTSQDREFILSAVESAKNRNLELGADILEFIGSLLLQKYPRGLDKEQQAIRREFTARFQQLTGPVMAKGFEDTALYRYYPLASLNEVGGNPACFGTSIDRFHRENRKRLKSWPHGLSATSTHDTKRSEDVRARINVLSEIPDDWWRAVHRWGEMNRGKKVQIEGKSVPDATEEYLIYQTLVGAWPPGPMAPAARADFLDRIHTYLVKALREAKVNTSWTMPQEAHEQAVRDFVQAILRPAKRNPFLSDFKEFLGPVVRAGLLNSISQTLLKIASPGVPDFYQGTETWNFSLVDPDNRRPVDYTRLKRLLSSLRGLSAQSRERFLQRLLSRPENGLIKLYVTSRALQLRRSGPELFGKGDYLPLTRQGKRKNHVCAFARVHGETAAIAIAARFFFNLGDRDKIALGHEVWGDTAIRAKRALPPGTYRDIFTRRKFQIEPGGSSLSVAQVLSPMSVALLERIT